MNKIRNSFNPNKSININKRELKIKKREKINNIKES